MYSIAKRYYGHDRYENVVRINRSGHPTVSFFFARAELFTSEKHITSPLINNYYKQNIISINFINPISLSITTEIDEKALGKNIKEAIFKQILDDLGITSNSF
jgi:hypothetical protein|tara:strand:- start:296 stop:604 length:309 start_codon:yes stop_codon:yes gene_type:complete